MDIIRAFHKEGFMVKKFDIIEGYHDFVSDRYSIVAPGMVYNLNYAQYSWDSIHNMLVLLWMNRCINRRIVFHFYLDTIVYERDNNKGVKLQVYPNGANLSICDGFVLMIVSTTSGLMIREFKNWLPRPTSYEKFEFINNYYYDFEDLNL